MNCRHFLPPAVMLLNEVTAKFDDNRMRGWDVNVNSSCWLVNVWRHTLQEKLISEMSRDREQLMSEHASEREQMISRFTAEREQLNTELTSTLRDRDDRLIHAEHDRQQVHLLTYLLTYCRMWTTEYWAYEYTAWLRWQTRPRWTRQTTGPLTYLLTFLLTYLLTNSSGGYGGAELASTLHDRDDRLIHAEHDRQQVRLLTYLLTHSAHTLSWRWLVDCFIVPGLPGRAGRNTHILESLIVVADMVLQSRFIAVWMVWHQCMSPNCVPQLHRTDRAVVCGRHVVIG